jgi:hypothetical protein
MLVLIRHLRDVNVKLNPTGSGVWSMKSGSVAERMGHADWANASNKPYKAIAVSKHI